MLIRIDGSIARVSGIGPAMDESPQTWTWKCPVPVRDDADSVFVPCSAMPGASVGDNVVLEAESGGEGRTGTITAMSQGDDEMFFRVALDPQ